MATYATSKLSSKGQVVIPEEIRKRLGLEPGDRFVVVGEGDTVVFKAISPPSMTQFDELIATAREQAKLAGLTPDSVTSAVKRARP